MSSKPIGKLYLIPTVIAPDTEQKALPADLFTLCDRIDYYLVENIRTARRCLSAMKVNQAIQDIVFKELHKKTSPEEITELMKPLFEGNDVGIMSEAGCPGVADPGALAVEYAHKNGIKVVPFVGPSSILLALMGSGFSGQSFAFNGYLPINKKDKQQALKKLEDMHIKTGQTQLFMETPYRNNQLLEDIIKSLNNTTRLCVAKNINAPDELIQTKTIKQWSSTKIDLHKVPCIFLIG